MGYVKDGIALKLAVVCLEGITVNQQDKAFESLKRCASKHSSKYRDCLSGNVEGISFARQLFHAIGIGPAKHRPASEALLNRTLKGKPFYSVNTLVDTGNRCSLDFLLPICVYDVDKIKGEAIIRKGLDNESYLGLNNLAVNLKGRYVISDEIGPFGSPITDSLRTLVDNTTARAVLTIFAPQGYSFVLLREKAVIFADRALSIWRGECKEHKYLWR